MRAVGIELERVRAPLTTSVGNARTRWSAREGLLLRLRDEDGRLGQGEASPLPGYSTDTIGECESAFLRLDPHRVPIDDLAHLALWLERSRLPPAARFAVETAALDLLGQRTGRPLWSLLGGKDDARVPLSALLPADPHEWEDAARRAIARGVHTLKCKVGVPGAFSRELDALHSLRRVVGDGIALRLDANGALPPERVRDLLAQLASVRPELIEEPVSGPALVSLTDPAIPYAVDESLQHPDMLRALLNRIQEGACRAVVLKPMALGGSFACLRIAEAAIVLGARVIVTHLFDGPIALTASAALALALAPHALACGLDPHPGLDVWPTLNLPCFEPDSITAPRAAGLGLPLPGGTRP